MNNRQGHIVVVVCCCNIVKHSYVFFIFFPRWRIRNLRMWSIHCTTIMSWRVCRVASNPPCSTVMKKRTWTSSQQKQQTMNGRAARPSNAAVVVVFFYLHRTDGKERKNTIMRKTEQNEIKVAGSLFWRCDRIFFLNSCLFLLLGHCFSVVFVRVWVTLSNIQYAWTFLM